MLLELRNVKQNDPLLVRRCFSGGDLHLNTWEDPSGSLVRFRLAYPGTGNRRLLLAWDKGSRFTHFAVDDGEATGSFYKSSPQLTHAPPGNLSLLAAAFTLAIGDPPFHKPHFCAVLRLLQASEENP